jgi:hypothetical protein
VGCSSCRSSILGGARAATVWSDTIRFVGAKQGVNYDGLGEAWCWKAYNPDGTSWHGYWVSDAYMCGGVTCGTGNALGEIAQYAEYLLVDAASISQYIH